MRTLWDRFDAPLAEIADYFVAEVWKSIPRSAQMRTKIHNSVDTVRDTIGDEILENLTVSEIRSIIKRIEDERP